MKRQVRYPVKLGFADGSGRDEFYITDSEDKVLIHGQGDCCKIGGIREPNVGRALVRLLNAQRPTMYLEVKS